MISWGNIKDSLDNRSGFSLVEVLVSVVLVAVSIVALLSTLSQSAVFSNRIDMFYKASYLAQRRIDVLKRFDFSELATESGEENGIRVDADGTISGSGDYKRTTEITPNFNGNQYLLKIKVSVACVKTNMDGSKANGEDVSSEFNDPVVMETLISDTT